PEAMAGGHEALPERGMVVDLAVADGENVAGFVAQGLSAARDVDDREAPAAERGATRGPGPITVRSAVRQRGAHPLADRVARRTDGSVDSAHGLAPQQHAPSIRLDRAQQAVRKLRQLLESRWLCHDVERLAAGDHVPR